MADEIEYVLIRSKRRTVSIQISKDGEVIVRAPLRHPKYKIDRFVLDNEKWIDSHRQKVLERNERREALPQLTQAEIDALKKEARPYLKEVADYYAGIIGVKYARMSIRAQKSRWGSCSKDGNLNFNCLLMLTPPEVRHYIVVHELCHLKEMNHSPRFWSLVENVIPTYKKQRAWLRKEGSDLISRLPK